MKKPLLFGILILTISFFTNCQKENIDESEVKTLKVLPQLKAVISDGGKLIKNDRKLNNLLNTFASLKKNTKARTVTSNEYGFSIDTTRIQQIETTSYKSYTFTVERESYDETILENYVYTMYNDSTVTQYLITYPLKNYSEFDIATATIQNINDNSLIYNRESDCQGYAAVVEYQEPICTDNNCNEGGDHSPGQACNDGVYRATRTCTQGGWVETGCSGGSVNGNTNPNDNNQTIGGATNNTNETDNDLVVVPLPINYDLLIEICINGITLNGQTDNTTIDSNMLSQIDYKQKALIYNNLQNNGCSEEAQEDAINQIEILINPYIDLDDDLVSVNNLDNDCAKNIIVEEIFGNTQNGTNAGFINKIRNIFNNDSDVTLLFRNDDVSVGNGVTSFDSDANIASGHYSIAITLDNAYLNNNPTKLHIALVVIHEMVHSLLMYKYLHGTLLTENPSYTNLNTAMEVFLDNRNDINGQALDDAMHIAMVDFIGTMSYSLFKYAENAGMNNVTQQYCKDIVKGSFYNTPAMPLINTGDNTAEELNNKNVHEQDNTANSHGDDC